MTYRFKFEIIEEDTDEVVLSGSTYVSESISIFGDCESVDMEVGKAMRNFRELKNQKDETESE